MMITNLILIYPAEPFLRKGNTAIINICPKICGQPGKLYFLKKKLHWIMTLKRKKLQNFFQVILLALFMVTSRILICSVKTSSAYIRSLCKNQQKKNIEARKVLLKAVLCSLVSFLLQLPLLWFVQKAIKKGPVILQTKLKNS